MSFDAFSDNYGFNTQPPEGGWDIFKASDGLYLSFNTQPPEGGWSIKSVNQRTVYGFQHTAA